MICGRCGQSLDTTDGWVCTIEWTDGHDVNSSRYIAGQILVDRVRVVHNYCVTWEYWDHIQNFMRIPYQRDFTFPYHHHSWQPVSRAIKDYTEHNYASANAGVMACPICNESLLDLDRSIVVEWGIEGYDRAGRQIVEHIRAAHISCRSWPYWEMINGFFRDYAQNDLNYVWPKDYYSWRYIERVMRARLARVHRISQSGQTSRSISLALRFQILSRDNYRCNICGRSAADGVTLEIDHRHPYSRGGATNPDNLWVLCFDCNRGKRDRNL